MADQTQLDLLKAGVEGWNTWREANSAETERQRANQLVNYFRSLDLDPEDLLSS